MRSIRVLIYRPKYVSIYIVQSPRTGQLKKPRDAMVMGNCHLPSRASNLAHGPGRRCRGLPPHWGLPGSIANPRIQHRVDDVDDEVGEANQRGVEREDPDRDVVVAGEDAGDELLSKTWDAEDVLDDNG